MFTWCSSAVNRIPLSSFAARRTRFSPFTSFSWLGVRFELGSSTLRLLPTVRVLPATDGRGASRFSCVKFLYMLGVFDSAGPKTCSRLRTS